MDHRGAEITHVEPKWPRLQYKAMLLQDRGDMGVDSEPPWLGQEGDLLVRIHLLGHCSTL